MMDISTIKRLNACADVLGESKASAEAKAEAKAAAEKPKERLPNEWWTQYGSLRAGR